MMHGDIEISNPEGGNMETAVKSFYDLPAEKIKGDEEKIIKRKREYLTRSGWKDTSSTPGCYWMYEKEWDGKTFLVDVGTAFRIQSQLDAKRYMRAHPEEYEE
jgi:hypothetical protein